MKNVFADTKMLMFLWGTCSPYLNSCWNYIWEICSPCLDSCWNYICTHSTHTWYPWYPNLGSDGPILILVLVMILSKVSLIVTFFMQQILSTKLFISNALVMSFKFLVLIAVLVFIRGGIPRYRYDFLTKLGWIKFLSWVLASFLISLSLIIIF